MQLKVLNKVSDIIQNKLTSSNDDYKEVDQDDNYLPQINSFVVQKDQEKSAPKADAPKVVNPTIKDIESIKTFLLGIINSTISKIESSQKEKKGMPKAEKKDDDQKEAPKNVKE